MTAANELSKNWQAEFEKFKQSFEKLSFVNVEEWKEISRALEHLQSDHLQKYPTQNTESPGKEFGIIGESESLCALLNLIRKIAPSDSTVLISGENGTGKEGTAKALHKLSPRGQKGAPFSIVNCGALSENLLESELFGHVKGAFTGAHVDKKGHFETAHEGTLFLDEIGETSPALQVKLLRVLQEGTFIPVGGTREKKINVRVLAATNQDLKDMIKKKLFREDLYFRLNVFNLKLPPLRDRPSDIPIIAKHYVNLFSQNLGFGQKFLTPSCIDTLMSYNWPGNIRELRNEMERLCVLSGDENCLLADYLSPDMRESLVPNYSHENDANGAQFAHGLLDMVDEFRREKITAALKASPQNFTQAARLLRFTPQGLRRLMKALGMNDVRQ